MNAVAYNNRAKIKKFASFGQEKQPRKSKNHHSAVGEKGLERDRYKDRKYFAGRLKFMRFTEARCAFRFTPQAWHDHYPVFNLRG